MDCNLLTAMGIAITIFQIAVAFIAIMIGDTVVVQSKKHFFLHFIPLYFVYVCINRFVQKFRKL